MPNFEAIAPILKDIESKAEEANKIYNEDKKSSLSTSIISPKIMESEQRNQIITELKGIRKKIEELNPSKNYTTPQKKEKTEVKENKGKIEKITIIKKDSGKFLLAINDNYGETKELKSSSKWWKIFIREIEERNMKPETRTNVEEITKDMSVYFNYNDEKCPIYMNGKYALTEIFVGQRADTIINPEIKTEIIPESKFLSRKNKKSKK